MSKSKNTRAKTNQNTVEPQMQRTDVVFGAISNHPFIFTVIVCLMMFPFGFAQKENISEAGIVVEAILWIIAAAALTVLGKPGRTQKETITFFLALTAKSCSSFFFSGVIMVLLKNDLHCNKFEA